MKLKKKRKNNNLYLLLCQNNKQQQPLSFFSIINMLWLIFEFTHWDTEYAYITISRPSMIESTTFAKSNRYVYWDIK